MLWSIVKDTRNDNQRDYRPDRYDLDKAAKDIAKNSNDKK